MKFPLSARVRFRLFRIMTGRIRGNGPCLPADITLAGYSPPSFRFYKRQLLSGSAAAAVLTLDHPLLTESYDCFLAALVYLDFQLAGTHVNRARSIIDLRFVLAHGVKRCMSLPVECVDLVRIKTHLAIDIAIVR